jgi:uncharacterized protein (DUF1697 family)
MCPPPPAPSGLQCWAKFHFLRFSGNLIELMSIYVTMLRGINVGAHKRIKMEQLRTSFQELGFEQVKTYIQSGNVIFKTARVSEPVLIRRVEKKLLEDFGFPVSVISRTAEEMAKAVRNNPFLQDGGIDPDKLHLTFLSDDPASSALRKCETLTVAPDKICHSGRELYLYLPNGVSGSSLMKSSLDRVLAVTTTTRNWRTVNTLHQMCRDCR